MKQRKELLRLFARERDEKSARGLRVGRKIQKGALRRGQHRELRLHIVHVAVSTGGDDAHFRHVARLIHQREGAAVQTDRYAAALRHLKAMAEQAKACNVGAGVHALHLTQRFARFFVERCHVGIDRVARGL